jgi:uncharacterized phage-like protein YoqJ
MESKPHSSGLVVDLALIEIHTNQSVMFYDNQNDGSKSWFIDFYKDKTDEKSIIFHKIQTLLINTMLEWVYNRNKKRSLAF